MQILVTYHSETGNTRRVAEAIYGALSCPKEIMPMEQVESLEGYNLIFLGAPVHQFGLPKAVRQFITAKTAGKHMALFVTHAMSGETDDPDRIALFEKELSRCRGVLQKAILEGFFHCRGELGQQAAQELIDSGIPMLQEFARMRSETIGHPSRQELDQARAFAAELSQKILRT